MIDPQAQPASGARDPFAALGLATSLVKAVRAEGYETPTPIQERAIPPVLDGRDLLGCAQTGTGKTAAFVLPILQRLAKTPRTGKIRALIVAPTRELSAQIAERVSVYGAHANLRHTVIYGGVGQRAQEEALARKPDILIATPGRLLDLMDQRYVQLDGVEIFVLDEADRMLDMGFIHDVKKIVAAVPRKRQTLLFSATIPKEIESLVASVLKDPVHVSIRPDVTTAETVEQCVYLVSRAEKKALLVHLLKSTGATRAIVFTRTKHAANRLADQLSRSGLDSAAIHGNKSQGARERALEGFRVGTVPVLVATDLAARGIDVDGVTHVVNFDLPNVPESYVHRIGRTGRAGAKGAAIAFCDPDERGLLRDIERFIGRKIPVAGGAPSFPPEPDDADPRRAGGGRGNGRPGSSNRNGGGRPAGGGGGRPNHGGGGGGRGPAPRPRSPAPAVTTASGAPAPRNDGSPPPLPGDSTRRRRRYRGARLS